MGDLPPGERPDFEPPEGQPPLEPAAGRPSPEPVPDLPGGLPAWEPPSVPAWQPPAGVPQPAQAPPVPAWQPPAGVPQPPQAPPAPPGWPPPPDVPVQHQDPLPPGPYKQPWVPPRPRRQPLGRGSILLGMAISLGSLAIAWWLTVSTTTGPLSNVTGGAILIVPLVLLVVGVVLAALPKTTRTGAGILLGLGASVLIAAGLCFALLAQYSG